MDKKKTAVEWVVEEIIKHDKSFAKYYGAEIDQAIEMEKQQIIDAYRDGGYIKFKKLSEQYYNETFNK